MKKSSLRNIILYSITAVYLTFSVMMFYIFNTYFYKSYKEKMVDENNYSANVAIEFLNNKKEEVLREASNFSVKDIVYYALKDNVFVSNDIKAQTLKNLSDTDTMKWYLEVIRKDKLSSETGIAIYKKIDGLLKFKADSRMYFKDFFNSGDENYIMAAIRYGIGEKMEIASIEYEKEKFYLKGVSPVGINRKWIQTEGKDEPEIPGVIVATREIGVTLLSDIKKVCGKDIILVDAEGRINSSTLDDFYSSVKGIKIEVKNDERLSREILINNILYEVAFVPITNYDKKVIGYFGTAYNLSKIEELFNKGMKNVVIFELIFFILLILIFYSVVQKLFKPLENVILRIKKISKKEDSEKGPIETYEEFQPLLDELNNLSETVNKREEELIALNLSLENKVEERTGELKELLNRLNSISKMVSVIYTEKDEKNAISYILAIITSKLGLNFKKAAYLEYNKAENILAGKVAFHNISEDEKSGKTMDEIIKSIEETERQTINIHIKLSENFDFRTVIIENKPLCFKGKKSYSNKKEHTPSIEFENFCMLPVVFENNKYGIIITEGLDNSKKLPDDELETLKVFSTNLAIYFENRMLESERVRTEKLETMVKLASSIVHEVRTPLVSIKGFAEIAKKKYESDDKISGYMDTIIGESGRIDEMAQRLLEYSGKNESNFKTIKYSLRKLIKDEISKWNIELDSCKIETEVEIPEEIEVEIDRRSFKKALGNIIKNAIEASKGYNDSILFSARALENDKHKVEIMIKNNGVDIPEEVLPKIFEPLITTKIQGTGLGLTFAKETVEKHGGTIEVKSEKGMGATIVIKI